MTHHCRRSRQKTSGAIPLGPPVGAGVGRDGLAGDVAEPAVRVVAGLGCLVVEGQCRPAYRQEVCRIGAGAGGQAVPGLGQLVRRADGGLRIGGVRSRRYSDDFITFVRAFPRNFGSRRLVPTRSAALEPARSRRSVRSRR